MDTSLLKLRGLRGFPNVDTMLGRWPQIRFQHFLARKYYGGCAIQLKVKFNHHGRKRKISFGDGARLTGRHISVLS